MKIIGGRDYYDSAGYGVDETVMFLRKEREFTDTPMQPRRPIRYGKGESGLYFHYILMGGQVYPALRAYEQGYHINRRNYLGNLIYKPSRENWFYGAKEGIKALHDLPVETYSAYYTKRTKQRYAIAIENHFSKTEDPAWINWMIENHAITGIISDKRAGYNKKSNTAKINVDRLKDIDFYRVVDPATAHMQIANFIGGVLPTATDTVELNDIDRIRKAGFDTKTSFRKSPTKRIKAKS